MKTYTISISRNNRTRDVTGTLEDHIKYFSYTLEVGASWPHEKGNKKINQQPKTIKSLITNLNNAENNAAANGWSNTYYDLAA